MYLSAISYRICFYLRISYCSFNRSINFPLKLAVLFLFLRLQEARLEVLKRILEQREEDHAELNTKRLDRLWSVYEAQLIVC